MKCPISLAPMVVGTLSQFVFFSGLGRYQPKYKNAVPVAVAVAAQSFASLIFGKGKKDEKRYIYGLKTRVRWCSPPQGEEYDDDIGELICKKHKKEQ